MGIRQWLGIGGSSDGSTSGTFSMWKVASGVGSVVVAASDAILTDIKTAVQSIAGYVAKLDIALSTRAAETTLGSVKTAVELIDDPVVATDAAAAAKNMQTGGVAYADPSVLPADVSANGDSVPTALSRKGEVYVYPSRLGHGEGDTVPPLRVITKGASYRGVAAANAVVSGAGTLVRFKARATTAGVVSIYDAATATGTPVCELAIPTNDTRFDLPGIAIGTAISVGFDGTFVGAWEITFKANS